MGKSLSVKFGNSLISLRRKSSVDGLATDEQGVALIELALIFPFLFFLFLTTMEFWLMLYNYMIMGQVAREGVRLASELAELEPNVAANAAPCTSPFADENLTLPATGRERHLMVQSRMWQLIGWEPELRLAPGSITIGSEFIEDSDVDNNFDNTVCVVLSGTYQGQILPISFNLSVEERGPYLYK